MKTEYKRSERIDLLYHLKISCRCSLGIVWIWEGLVPKILAPTELQRRLVVGSGLFWPDPDTFLIILGSAMIVAGGYSMLWMAGALGGADGNGSNGRADLARRRQQSQLFERSPRRHRERHLSHRLCFGSVETRADRAGSTGPLCRWQLTRVTLT